MTKGTDPSGMKVWVIPPEKSRPAEVFAEGKWNTAWAVEEGSYKYQLRLWDQIPKWDLYLSQVFMPCL